MRMCPAFNFKTPPLAAFISPLYICSLQNGWSSRNVYETFKKKARNRCQKRTTKARKRRAGSKFESQKQKTLNNDSSICY